jgi:hypothetical protein
VCGAGGAAVCGGGGAAVSALVAFEEVLMFRASL